MTDKAYAAEVARKQAAGIKLTQPKDTAALARAATTPTAAPPPGSGTTQQLIYGMTPAAYAAEVARKQAAGIKLTQPLQSGYGASTVTPPPGSIAPGGGGINPLNYPSFDAYQAATAGGAAPPPGGAVPPAGGGGLNPLDYPSFEAYQAATAGAPPPGVTPTAGDYWSQYTGGREGYAASQQQRYEQARAAGDTDLMRRLEADAQRVGYSLAGAGAPEEKPILPPYIPEEMAPFAPPPVPYQQEVGQLLQQIQGLIGQPVRPEDYPGYQGMQEASQQQAAKASQQAMEILNQRGILNSTVTRDQVNEIEQQAMIQLMPRLFELAYGMRQDQIGQLMNLLNTYSGLGQQEYAREVESQRWFYEQQVAQQAAAIEAEEQKVKAAWDRVKNLGYVDNSASVALGIPVGTPTYEAQKDVENRLHQLELAKQNNAAQLQRTQYTQGQIGARAGAEKTPTPYQQWQIMTAEEQKQAEAATRTAKSQIVSWFNQGKSTAEIIDSIAQQATTLEKKMVDVQKLMQYAETMGESLDQSSDDDLSWWDKLWNK